MNRSLPRITFFAVAAACVCLLASVATAAPVKGRAFGAWLHLPSKGISDQTICDSGWLQPGGALRTNYTGYTEIPGVFEFYSMDVTSESDDDCDDDLRGTSTARLETVVLLYGQPGEITFTSLIHSDDDECCNPDDDDDATLQITDLTLEGQPVVVTGQVDQTVPFSGGTLVINERRRDDDDDCDDDDATFHGLHLYFNNGEEVILSSVVLDDDDDCCFVDVKPSTWGTLKLLYR